MAATKQPPPPDRFLRAVKKSDSCWEWAHRLRKNGYGQFRIGDRMIIAHRVSYELFVGPIPAGLEIDHLCRNRGCVNPSHLEPVTKRVNILRGAGAAAVNAAKTHCIHGHEFRDDNTYVRTDGARICRTCNAAAVLRYKGKNT